MPSSSSVATASSHSAGVRRSAAGRPVPTSRRTLAVPVARSTTAAPFLVPTMPREAS
ncbi:MAG TPA: hypothetical protein VF640_02060 [Acidimicrobiales bacterium]